MDDLAEASVIAFPVAAAVSSRSFRLPRMSFDASRPLNGSAGLAITQYSVHCGYASFFGVQKVVAVQRGRNCLWAVRE
jgi:hypothetical protein